MSENHKNLFLWQHPLGSGDRNPISQQLSTLVGLPPAEKTAKIGHVLFEKIGPEGPVQTLSSFGSQGYPSSLQMVPFDRRQNFLHFFCWNYMSILRRFGVMM